MSILECLDIILITHNRKKPLSHMISCIFAENSPIKHCTITFLNNCSTDGTTEMLDELAESHNNVKHVCHRYNIGGNANIVRALELASKEYFWILCDDDTIDWTHWEYLEKAILSKQYDIISTYCSPFIPHGEIYEDRIAAFIIEATFLPSAIYRTVCVDNTVIFNAYFNIHTLFPHLALIFSIINRNGSIYHMEPFRQVLYMLHSDDHEMPENNSYTRGLSHPNERVRTITWQGGFALALELLEDDSIRRACVNYCASFKGQILEGYIVEDVFSSHSTSYLNILSLYIAGDVEQKDRICGILEYLKMIDERRRNKSPHILMKKITLKSSLKHIRIGLRGVLHNIKESIKKRIRSK